MEHFDHITHLCSDTCKRALPSLHRSNMSASDAGVVSLAELIRHHRELLVHPLFWTSRHLEMTGCRFQHVEIQHIDNVSQIEHPQDDQRSSKGLPNDGESEARSLAKSFSLQGKLNALANILLSNGSILDKRSKGPDFIFAGRPVHRPHYTVFYRNDQPNRPVCQEEPLPVIGYLNYTNVSGLRWHKSQPHQHHRGGDNAAVRRLSREKLARVTPKEWKEDPYFVCVLLSLAQLQERRLLKPQMRTSHLSRLLVASPMDREFIHIYEAQITSDLLAMLDNPTTTTIKANFPTIEHRQIPFKPFETFQKRIWSALLIDKSPPHVSDVPVGTCSNVINQHFKRPHEQEDDESRKQGRTS